MANNVVSQWLISEGYAADDLNGEDATLLAAKLDRLVAAVKEYEQRTTVEHTINCGAWSCWEYHCNCGAIAIESELTAALAGIELPKESDAQP